MKPSELLRAVEVPEVGTFDHEVWSALAEVRYRLGTFVSVSRSPLFGLDIVDLLARRLDGARWLVSGLITRGGVAIIGGEPKSIKTWLHTAISLAIATGTKLFGRFDVEPGVVAIFFAEDGEPQSKSRFAAQIAANGFAPDRGRLFVRPRGAFLDLMRDEDLAWIIASCRSMGRIDLLVLDPLRDISSAAEDKSDEMSPLMRRLRLLGEILGCTVLVVHHTGKSGADTAKRRPGQRLRGSGAIHGSIDSGIYLSDLTGDGVSVFRCTLDSEVKGARSAGRLTLELSVKDNEHGEAVKASWAVIESPKLAPMVATKFEPTVSADAESIVAFMRDKGMAMTKTELSANPLVPQKRSRKAIDSLIASGRITVQPDGKIGLPEAPHRASVGQALPGKDGQA